MTLAAPDQLADPLARFYAQDPTVLEDAPPPPPPVAIASTAHERIAWEIAAAVIVAGVVIRRHLAEQQPQVGQTGQQARSAWTGFSATWLRLVVPAIRQAYLLGRVDGLTDDELTALATDYARGIGDYLNETSATALEEGFNAQVSQRWDVRVAWYRASAAYGLDSRDMKNYLKAAITDRSVDPVPAVARALVDKAFLVRAERIGVEESYSATQAGQAVTWLWLQKHGRLPAGCTREWEIGENEEHCAVCSELALQAVPLDQPFVLKSGAKIWAPRAHPRCHCRVKLNAPREEISKADEHWKTEPRAHGRWAKVADADPVTEDVKPTAPAKPSSPFRGPESSPFHSGSPFRSGNPFQAQGPFRAPASTTSPFRSAFHQRRPRPQSLEERRVIITGLPRERPEVTAEPYVMAVDDFHIKAGRAAIGATYGISGLIDFNRAETPPIASSEISPWDCLDQDVVVMKSVPASMTRGELEESWDNLERKARLGFNVAFTEVDDGANPIGQRLTDADLRRIWAMAGFENESDGTEKTRQRMIQRVTIAVRHHGKGLLTDSLAEAYGDYATYVEPVRLLGRQTGQPIEHALNEAEQHGMEVRSYDHVPIPTEQVFSFAEGFHPHTQANEHDAHVVSHFSPYAIEYQSALAHYPEGEVPPMRFGLQVLHMIPMVHAPGVQDTWVPLRDARYTG